MTTVFAEFSLRSRRSLSLFLLLSTATAADLMPQPGSYAFNWLDADSHCNMLTQKDLAQVKSCTASTNAFGLEMSSHVCKVSARIELMVYETQTQCQEALATMQANGP